MYAWWPPPTAGWRNWFRKADFEAISITVSTSSQFRCLGCGSAAMIFQPWSAPSLIGLLAKMGKDVRVIPEDTQEALVQHDWPGNVRELQNFIERAVILSTGYTLCVPPHAFSHSMGAEQVATMTLDDLQRGHILKTLEAASWVVGGPHGAAARLGVKRTTLISRMQRLGIAFSKAEGIIPSSTPMPWGEVLV
jgi:hypothetical protein